MATQVPQRQLRNETAALLRRVQAGEQIEITVHGHPVAALTPLSARVAFVPRERLLAELSGLLDPADDLMADIQAMDEPATDPFE